MTLPTKEELDNMNMQPIMDLFNPVPEVQFINEPAGVNHYRLLRWFGERFSRIADIGTYMGFSAACLMGNGNVVVSYDTDFKHRHLKLKMLSEIHFIKIKDTEAFDGLIGQADLILVDTWHEGKMERAIYDYLVSINWKGVLIYDDIYYNDAMKQFWQSLPEPKIDATHVGHLTGTGIIEFI